MTTLLRLPDWPELLAAFIEQRRHTPHAWGVNDCCLFAADEVLTLTRVDFAAQLRGTYATDLAALRILQAWGGVASLARAHLPEYGNPLQARRGDVVCVAIDGRDTLGVVAGNDHWCAPGESGLVFRPMAEVQLAFAVG